MSTDLEMIEMLNYRLPQVKLVMLREPVNPALEPMKAILGPSSLKELLKPLQGSPVEQLLVVLLDFQNNPIWVHVVSVGTVSSSIAHPREIFKPAILANASKIILAHNHPSGSKFASRDDQTVTKKVAEAGNMLDIPLLDHVIITCHGELVSIREDYPELFPQ